jgi:hypothetical protein
LAFLLAWAKVKGELRRKQGQEDIKDGQVMVEGGLVVGLALNASNMARKEVHDTTLHSNTNFLG